MIGIQSRVFPRYPSRWIPNQKLEDHLRGGRRLMEFNLLKSEGPKGAVEFRGGSGVLGIQIASTNLAESRHPGGFEEAGMAGSAWRQRHAGRQGRWLGDVVLSAAIC